MMTNSTRLGLVGLLALASSALGAVTGCARADRHAESTSNLEAGMALVISQVYGAGGNKGPNGTEPAAFANDYVEIFNRGAEPINLEGKALLYASGSEDDAAFAAINAIKLPAKTIEPGKYFLVQLASNNANPPTAENPPVGDALEGPDFVAPPQARPTGPEAVLNLSASKGTVALAKSLEGCEPAPVPTDPAAPPVTGRCAPELLDAVAYGGARNGEGTATDKLDNVLAAIRNDGGCADTNDNKADFTLAAPSPRNSSSAPHVCPQNGSSSSGSSGNASSSGSSGNTSSGGSSGNGSSSGSSGTSGNTSSSGSSGDGTSSGSSGNTSSGGSSGNGSSSGSTTSSSGSSGDGTSSGGSSGNGSSSGSTTSSSGSSGDGTSSGGSSGNTSSGGSSGSSGEGSSGSSGSSGGTQGPIGPQGPAGPQGEQGVAGKDGTAGKDGVNGKDGAKGEKGDRGGEGEVGPAGPPGADGVSGKEGAAGKVGPRGPAGEGCAAAPGSAGGAPRPLTAFAGLGLVIAALGRRRTKK